VAGGSFFHSYITSSPIAWKKGERGRGKEEKKTSPAAGRRGGEGFVGLCCLSHGSSSRRKKGRGKGSSRPTGCSHSPPRLLEERKGVLSALTARPWRRKTSSTRLRDRYSVVPMGRNSGGGGDAHPSGVRNDHSSFLLSLSHPIDGPEAIGFGGGGGRTRPHCLLPSNPFTKKEGLHRKA